MKEIIHIYGASGPLVDFGDDLIPLFTMSIRLVTDTDIRILRIKECEKQKLLKCKQIILNGADEIDLNFRIIQEQLHTVIGEMVTVVIHRNDDIEEKWVVCPKNMVFTVDEIRQQIYFQEQYFNIQIWMR